ncbi:hypothetical protein MASR1M36_15060 [Candidatus Cloacimonadaceae bacterium]
MNESEYIERIKELIETANLLKSRRSDISAFTQWKEEVDVIIRLAFNDSEEKLTRFSNISYEYHGAYFDGEPRDTTPYYVRGLNQAIGYFNAWSKELEMLAIQNPKSIADTTFSHKCFIVHGHNNLFKLEIKEFIDESEEITKLKPIILHKKPNEGKTVIEKFERHSDVDFAICIWTADDEGKSIEESTFKKRARQNVVIETGFFWGKLGRERVIILLEDGVEIPSDFRRMLYIPMKDNWKDELRKEISNVYK